MTSDIIVPPTGAGGELRPLSLQHIMTEALQVFRFHQDFEEAFSIADEAAELVKVTNRKFVALEQAKTREARFRSIVMPTSSSICCRRTKSLYPHTDR
jgi:hypothetical protein